MLYQAYQTHSDLMSPAADPRALDGGHASGRETERGLLRSISAAGEVLSRMRLTHARPAYGIGTVTVAGLEIAVTEEVLLARPFGSLLHFRRQLPDHLEDQPRVLLVAPLVWTLSPRCCATPSAPCCRTMTCTSPTGTTPAMWRFVTALSGWTTTSSI